MTIVMVYQSLLACLCLANYDNVVMVYQSLCLANDDNAVMLYQSLCLPNDDRDCGVFMFCQ